MCCFYDDYVPLKQGILPHSDSRHGICFFSDFISFSFFLVLDLIFVSLFKVFLVILPQPFPVLNSLI